MSSEDLVAAASADGSASEPRRRLRPLVEALQGGIVLLDLIAVLASAAAATMAAWLFSAHVGGLRDVAAFGLIGGLLFVAYLGARRAYSVTHLTEHGFRLRMVIQGWVFAFFMLGWIFFLTRNEAALSRGMVLVHFVVGGGLLIGLHVGGARWLARRFERGRLSLRRVALVAVSDPSNADAIRKDLALTGVEVIDTALISPRHLGKAGFHVACLEAVEVVKAAIASARLDGIYIFFPWRHRRQIDELRSVLGPLPVPLYLFADRETGMIVDRPRLRIGRMQGFEIQRAPLTRLDRALKRSFDIAVAGSAILILSPLMLLVSLAILVESGRPILFRQKRKGFGARPFEIFKFRSMTVQENGPVVTQASKNDARVTPLGRMLRRSSIDELPQLFNVLAGDMSIVGPRPHAIAHDDYYDGLIATYAFRLHVKPGITGWAQINGHRGATPEVGHMAARVEHDLWYINNWSPWLDMKIVLLTAQKVLFDDSAY